MGKKKNSEDYAKRLEESFARWEYLYTNGANDPNWPDGVNLNMVRNHILYYKRKIEEVMTLKAYPDVYHRPAPAEVDPNYVARKASPILATFPEEKLGPTLPTTATHPISKAGSRLPRKPQQQIQLSLFACMKHKYI